MKKGTLTKCLTLFGAAIAAAVMLLGVTACNKDNKRVPIMSKDKDGNDKNGKDGKSGKGRGRERRVGDRDDDDKKKIKEDKDGRKIKKSHGKLSDEDLEKLKAEYKDLELKVEEQNPGQADSHHTLKFHESGKTSTRLLTASDLYNLTLYLDEGESSKNDRVADLFDAIYRVHDFQEDLLRAIGTTKADLKRGEFETYLNEFSNKEQKDKELVFKLKASSTDNDDLKALESISEAFNKMVKELKED